MPARGNIPAQSVIPAQPEKEKKSAASQAEEPAVTVFLQVGSYREEGTAQSVAQRLSAKGYQALVSEKDIPEKGGKWYRVRTGPFKTRQEADTLQKKLQQDGFQTIVTGK